MLTKIRNRTTTIGLAVGLSASLLGQLPARAAGRAEPVHLTPQTYPTVTSVPLTGTPRTPSAVEAAALARTAARRPPVWPVAGTAEVDLSTVGRGWAAAGALPVRVGPAATPAGPDLAHGVAARTGAVASVRVQVLDRATAPAGYRNGVLIRVASADGSALAGRVAVAVDYGAFRDAFGADWVSRLRLWTVPECALGGSVGSGCGPSPLRSHNDLTNGTVSAEVPVAHGGGTVLALLSGASGPAGDFTSTSLSASATWSAGGPTGGFTYAFPLRVPPALGNLAPNIGLGYSSSSVDGRSEATNNQPSWVGEGWDLGSGSIERRYRPCASDMGGGANNTVKTGDQCWATDNAILSLNGSSTELVRDDASGAWRPRAEDGSRIERLDDTSNPADNTVNGARNNEYWKVTTSDGTQYFFGLNRLPGWATSDPTTDSVWTLPVFGNHPPEPCHQTTFAASSCTQAWRWNLDYVRDVNGNTMSYWYSPETNKYARNNTDSDDVSYVRAGTLTRIDYGTDGRDGDEYPANAVAQVLFGTADRCLSACGDPANWPDTPLDQECAAAATQCPGQYAPTFWTKRRLTTITTRGWDTSVAPAVYGDVDSWTLAQTFPSPGDNTRAGLWLDSIVRRGHVGGTITLPEVKFDPIQMYNRVDLGDGQPTMNWMRIGTVWTDSGAQIGVSYSARDCVFPGHMPSAPHTNTMRCYPALVPPNDNPDGPLETEWFHKYVVTAVTEGDRIGGAPVKATTYEYPGTPAWHYDDDDGLVQPDRKTWSQFRGYDRVLARSGDPGQQTLTETRYLRGMHGDRQSPAGGTTTVTVPATFGAPINDEDAFAGMVREQIVYNGVDTAPVTTTVNEPWQSAPTATRTINGDVATARFVSVHTTYQGTMLDGGRGWRTSKTVSDFDEYGMVTQTYDYGDLAVIGDERCTRTTYNRNVALMLLATVGRVQTFAVGCDVTPASTDDVMADARTSYDGLAYGAPPTRGLPTTLEAMKDWSVGGGPVYVTASRYTYDAYGRVFEAWNAKNQKTTTTYSPATGGPVTKITTSNPLGWTSSSDRQAAWGFTWADTDANGKLTEGVYDPLGRLVKVWLPNRLKANFPTSPSIEYAYQISTMGPAANAVTTRRLNASNNYIASYSLYDGLMRPRQTQNPGANGGRVVTDTLYDSVGRPYKTWGPYHTTGAPDTSVIGLLEWQVTTILETQYDRASRVTDSILKAGDGVSGMVVKSRTTTAYGGDRVYVTPPLGGTATTTISDIRGNIVDLRQHQGGTPAGAYTSTGYTFDRKGKLVAVTDPEGNQYTYGYDVAGRLIHTDHPDRGATTYTYNDAGELTQTEDARSEKLAYEYDVLGRRIGVYDDVISATTKRSTWTYDTLYNATSVKGQLATATRWVGTDAYTTQIRGYTQLYQSLGENYVIPAVETGLGTTYTYTRQYKVDGSPYTVAYPAAGGLSTETVTYAYDPVNGLPVGLNTNATGVTSYVVSTSYTEFGQPTIVRYKTGTSKWVERGYTYDPATGQLKVDKTQRETVPQSIADVHYDYDEIGNVTAMSDTPSGGNADYQCFRYDHLRRLTTAWTPSTGNCVTDPTTGGLGGPAPYWLSWGYDNVGNRRSEVTHAAVGATTRDYAYPAAGTDRPHAVQSVTTTPPVGSPSTVNYGYNATGDTTSRPGPTGAAQTIGWDAEGRLSILDSTTYLYNADGSRLLRRDPTGTTLYLPGMELRRTGGVTTATRYYTYGGTVCASRTPSALTWVASDRQGTEQIAVAITSAQTVTQRRQTPFGGARGGAVSWPNATGFVGGNADPASNDTGLVHLGARDYDPATGRFISVDPVQDLTDPQQWSAYAYSGNSPVTFSDASGAMYTDEAGGFGSTPASGPFGMAAYGQYYGSQHGYTGPSPYQHNNAYGDWYSCPGQGATCNNGNGKDPDSVVSSSPRRVVTTTNYNFGVLEEFSDGTYAINGVVLHEGHPDPYQLASAMDAYISSTGMYWPTPDELARMPSWMRDYFVYKAIAAGCSNHELIDCVNGGDFLADAGSNVEKGKKRIIDEMPHGLAGFCLNSWAAAYVQGGISGCVVPTTDGYVYTGTLELGQGPAFGFTSGVSAVHSNRDVYAQAGDFDYCSGGLGPVSGSVATGSGGTRTVTAGVSAGAGGGYACGRSYTWIAPGVSHRITRIR